MKTKKMIFGTLSATALAVALFAAPSPAAAGLDTNGMVLTPSGQGPWQANGVAEVLKMCKGGISADIIVSYIHNSQLSFYLSADNIISLQQEGVPQPVVAAMLTRYGETQRQAPMAQNYTVPRQAPVPQYAPEDPAANFNAALQARAATTLAPTYVTAPSYPTYDPYYYDSYYSDPYYYPYYGWGGPAFGIGFGYGYGYGYGGRFGGFGGRVGGGFGGRAGGGFAGHGGGGFGGHGGGGHR